MSRYSHTYPEDFDSEEELTPEEQEQINRCTDAILAADDDFAKWIEARHLEAVAAMEADPHRECFFDQHINCPLADKEKEN